MSKKKSLGQYFTKTPVWYDDLIKGLISENNRVVDPFAGDGDLLKLFPQTKGYDIDPTLGWQHNDSLLVIPKGLPEDICITNPPYLAKNSARKRKLIDTFKYFDLYPEYDDLYQIAIRQCLDAFDLVIAIIPETYISTNLFTDRLAFVNIIEDEMFSDTECPVLVAVWGVEKSDDFLVLKNSQEVGYWSALMGLIPRDQFEQIPMKFNHPDGALGIICFDSTTGKSLAFCRGEVIPREEIKHTSRAKTRVEVAIEVDDTLLAECNRILKEIRDGSQDVIMSPFKGNMKSGERRRRLDFALARKIINLAARNLGRSPNSLNLG